MSDAKRRIAVILFADIQGFTALMQADEPQAMTAINIFNSGLEKTVPVFHGLIVQYYGDGCLVQFDSSLEALQCAQELQLEFKDKENIPVRMGIHVGEVVFREGNIFGDAVNIASRLESMAVPGSILISQKVQDELKNQPDFQLISLGDFEFKNVERPMEVFALANSGLVVPDPKLVSGKFKTKPGSQKTWLFNRKFQIAGGLILLLIVGYVYIFHSRGLNVKTHKIEFTDPSGIKKTITMADDSYRNRVVIFPFEPEEDVDSNLWLKAGLPEAIRLKLALNKFINPVAQYYRSGNPQDGLAAMNFSTPDKIKATADEAADYFLDGTYQLENRQYIFRPTLHESKTGKVIEEQSFQGQDFSLLVDSINTFVKSTMKLRNDELDMEVDLQFDEMVTYELEVYKVLITNYYLQDWRNWGAWQSKDTTCAYAYYFTAFNDLIDGSIPINVIQDYATRAMRHRNRLPEEMQIPLMALYYWVHDDLGKAEEYYLTQIEMDPTNRLAIEGLLEFYRRTGQFKKAFSLWEKRYEAGLVKEDRILDFIELALINGEINLAERSVMDALKESPDNPAELTALAQVYLHQNNYTEAHKTLEKVLLLNPNLESTLSYQQKAIKFIEANPDYAKILPECQGIYRAQDRQMLIEYSIQGDHLFIQMKNQLGWFMYPDSMGSIARGFDNFAYRTVFLYDENNKIFGTEGSNTDRYTWKQDSLIWKAESLLKSGDYQEALLAYDQAIEQNPRHFYLSNGRAHVQYMLSHFHEEVLSLYRKLVGSYINEDIIWRSYIENDQYFIENIENLNRFPLYPISENEFIGMNAYRFVVKYKVDENGIMNSITLNYAIEDGQWFLNPDPIGVYKRAE